MNNDKLKITLGIISGRRPALLEETLSSFQEHLFSNLEIETVIANIDPFMGDINDQKKCESIIRKHFSQSSRVDITCPETPSFTMAVKRVWQKVRTEFMFHLEDDWICLEQIDIKRIEALFSHPSVTSISLLHKDKKINRLDFSNKDVVFPKTKINTCNFKIPRLFRPVYPIFSTSPSFFKGFFVRHVARLLLPELDPEKQFKDPRNMPLLRYIKDYQSVYYSSSEKGKVDVIYDIGRNYRNENKIKKVILDGQSYWLKGE